MIQWGLVIQWGISDPIHWSSFGKKIESTDLSNDFTRDPNWEISKLDKDSAKVFGLSASLIYFFDPRFGIEFSNLTDLKSSRCLSGCFSTRNFFWLFKRFSCSSCFWIFFFGNQAPKFWENFIKKIGSKILSKNIIKNLIGKSYKKSVSIGNSLI